MQFTDSNWIKHMLSRQILELGPILSLYNKKITLNFNKFCSEHRKLEESDLSSISEHDWCRKTLMKWIVSFNFNINVPKSVVFHNGSLFEKYDLQIKKKNDAIQSLIKNNSSTQIIRTISNF